MTLGGWAIFIILTICIIVVFVALCCSTENNGLRLLYVFLPIILVIGLYAVLNWYYSKTASGLRAMKSQESNFTNGIEREVTVYDVNGKVIKRYDGRFDVDYDDNRIIFDDENGKRHVIYYPTGTVIIDEK